MTYASLAGLFLAFSLLLAVLARRRAWLRWAAAGLTLLALLVLTAVFDNVMIAVGLFDYTSDHLSGLRLGLAPVEDFAWPVVAAALLPAIWELLGRRGVPARAAQPGAQPGGQPPGGPIGAGDS
ncbi:MAG TPA: lycopene cyclase domain-containing protein [Beutenbergiaceae bacterium]|nr:lycopene cyclase domain-containing protein [Beutenbergiaceae bacterium]